MAIEKLGGFEERPRSEKDSHPEFEKPKLDPEEIRTKRTDRMNKLAEVREALSDHSDTPDRYPATYFGSFADEQRRDHKIVLADSLKRETELKAKTFREGAKLMTSIVSGIPIATEYDNRTNNFSTQTNIIMLADGRKVFAVYAHPGSAIHRFLDTLMKWASGLKMRKVDRNDWKRAFEAKSNIPVIENDDPYTVLMPFHSNVNAYDLMANNHEIENFGENGWAKDVGSEEKIVLAESIMRELARVHGQGKAWGEAILPNIIFTKDRQPIICDPEIQYDVDVSFDEAKARDLKDIVISVCGALSRSEQLTDLEPVVRRLLQAYGDDPCLAELSKLAVQKRTWLQHLTFGYEQVRSGTRDKAQYDQVLEIIHAIIV